MSIGLTTMGAIPTLACDRGYESGDAQEISSVMLTQEAGDVNIDDNYKYENFLQDVKDIKYYGTVDFKFKDIMVYGAKPLEERLEIQKAFKDYFGETLLYIDGTANGFSMEANSSFMLNGKKRIVKSMSNVMTNRNNDDISNCDCSKVNFANDKVVFACECDLRYMISNSLYLVEYCDENGKNVDSVVISFLVDKDTVKLNYDTEVGVNDNFKKLFEKKGDYILDTFFNKDVYGDGNMNYDVDDDSNKEAVRTAVKKDDAKEAKETKNATTDNKKGTKDNTPKTGDTMSTGVTVALLAGGMSLVSIIGVYLSKKRIALKK